MALNRKDEDAFYIQELTSMTSREKQSGRCQDEDAAASLHDGGRFISCPGRRHFTEGHKPSFDTQSGRGNALPAVVAHALLELQGQAAAEELKKESGIVNRNSRKTKAVRLRGKRKQKVFSIYLDYFHVSLFLGERRSNAVLRN